MGEPPLEDHYRGLLVTIKRDIRITSTASEQDGCCPVREVNRTHWIRETLSKMMNLDTRL